MKYTDKAVFEKANSFGLGNPNDAFAQYFDGQSYALLHLQQQRDRQEQTEPCRQCR